MSREPDRAPDAVAKVIPIGPDLTTRVGAILESVQREADRILEQARAEAETVRGPDADPEAERMRRRLVAVCGELGARAEQLLAVDRAAAEEGDAAQSLGESFERLARALARAADALADETDREVAFAATRDGQAAAQRAAVDLAALGRTRAQVGEHLRDLFDLKDPAPVLDRVFGPGTPPGERVAWAVPPTG